MSFANENKRGSFGLDYTEEELEKQKAWNDAFKFGKGFFMGGKRICPSLVDVWWNSDTGEATAMVITSLDASRVRLEVDKDEP